MPYLHPFARVSRRLLQRPWAACVAVVLFFSCGTITGQGGPIEPGIRAGAAKVDITPTHPVVLAGYGDRTTECSDMKMRLWARALMVRCGKPVLLIAVDNCGIPAALCEQVADVLCQSHGLERSQVVIAVTHTHNAPSLPGYAPILWQGRVSETQQQHQQTYAAWLAKKLVEVADAAFRSERPAKLSWGQGRVTFGGNRRVLENGHWVNFGFERMGPVDHALPVLLVGDESDVPIAVWCNYACHCTTLGPVNAFSGDWAGYANELLEQQWTGAIAVTTIGFGADVGPQPAGTDAVCQQHGQAIANEVNRLIQTKADLTPLTQPISVAGRTVNLPLAAAPPKSHWEMTLSDRDPFRRELAQSMLNVLNDQRELPTHVPLPITAWKFGNQLAIVMVGGEVCVDYAVRLKSLYDWKRLWLQGWSNDVPGYIPSRRVLAEGGYEADFSMVYYGHPNRFADDVEDQLVNAVRELLGAEYASHGKDPYPLGRIPAE